MTEAETTPDRLHFNAPLHSRIGLHRKSQTRIVILQEKHSLNFVTGSLYDEVIIARPRLDRGDR